MKQDEPVPSSQLHTVATVAKRLAVSQSLVYQLIESGKLGHHRIGTGRGTIRVCETDLEAYLAECHADARQPQPLTRPRRKRLKHIRI